MSTALAPTEQSIAEHVIRDGLAVFATIAGWRVQKEVVLAGWGRIDLVIDDSSRRLIVECKRELAHRRDLKRGILQTHGYHRMLKEVPGKTTAAYLVADRVAFKNPNDWGRIFDVGVMTTAEFKQALYNEAYRGLEVARLKVAALEVVFTPALVAEPIAPEARPALTMLDVLDVFSQAFTE